MPSVRLVGFVEHQLDVLRLEIEGLFIVITEVRITYLILFKYTFNEGHIHVNFSRMN